MLDFATYNNIISDSKDNNKKSNDKTVSSDKSLSDSTPPRRRKKRVKQKKYHKYSQPQTTNYKKNPNKMNSYLRRISRTQNNTCTAVLIIIALFILLSIFLIIKVS